MYSQSIDRLARSLFVRYGCQLIIGLALGLAVSIAACSRGTPEPFNSPLGMAFTSPVLTPRSSEGRADSLPVSTPLPTMGNVMGLLQIAGSGEPASGAELYLGSLIGESEGYPLVTLNQDSAPRAITDETGRFTFVNVPPGTYGLIVWSPISSLLVSDPETGYSLFITVEPDKTTDLGELTSYIP